MPDRESGVPHPSGGVDQLVKQPHLDGGPASVRACRESQSVMKVLPVAHGHAAKHVSM